MNKLLLHPQTKLQLKSFLKNPAHALLLVGPAGVGKESIARAVAARLLNVNLETVDSYPFFFFVTPTSKSEISIDQIRQLVHQMSLKVPPVSRFSKLVLIAGAETMSQEAQNSILKILEEPPEDGIFILTAPSTRSLLPTIVSRSQLIHVRQVTLPAAIKFYSGSRPSAEVGKMWQLSQAGAGLLDALLKEQDSHPLKQAVEQAKIWLGSNGDKRFLTVDNLSKDKQKLQLFLQGLEKILSVLHHSNINKNRSKLAIEILRSRRVVLELSEALDSYVSPKLVASRLILEIQV